MKYIKKAIADECGCDNECWVANRGQFSIADNITSFSFDGWKNATSKNTGTKTAASRWTSLNPNAIPAYAELFTELLGRLISDEGPLQGGTVDEEGSITCSRFAPTGHEMTYWRAATGSFSLERDDGVVGLQGWRDKDAYEAKFGSGDCVEMRIKLSELSSFEAAWIGCATALLTDEKSPFYGGTLEDL